ncbi:MAG: EAL domain-containing protein [Lacticaseibacillus absianus]
MPEYQFQPSERRQYETLPIPLGIYQVVDGKTRTLLVSDQLCQLMGMSREELVKSFNDNMFAYVHPADIGKLNYYSEQLHLQGNKFSYNIFYLLRNAKTGNYQHVHTIGRVKTMADGSVVAFLFYENLDHDDQEMSESRRAYAKKSRDVINTDELTGLPNSHFIDKFAMEKVAELRESGGDPVAVLVNISNMKGYNNQFGQTNGSHLLAAVANRLSIAFPSQLVARWKGDRFIVFTLADGLAQTLAKLHRDFRDLVDGDAADISFGVYAIQEGDTMQQIIDRSSFAMSQIGEDRRLYVMKYDQAAEARNLSENYFLDHLQEAMDKHWIQVFFQPIYDNHTGKVSDYEALARWIDPQRGLVGPGQFIPVIEKRHLTHYLDRYMLIEVLKKLRAWKANGVPLHPVSINLSHEDFEWPQIVADIQSQVQKYGIDPSLISIEITERDLCGDMTLLQEKMSQLHEAGFDFWMDDFGSGYSSLNSLYEYRFDLLKLDMKFVQHLDQNNGINRKLLASLVQMAMKMGLRTLCEGVETEEEYSFVKEIGVDKTQGFLLAKPQPLDEFARPVPLAELRKLVQEEIDN